MKCADDLSGLPPAYIATSEFDPLRDEGILYGLRLLQAGVAAEIHNFSGTYHGSEIVETAEISQRRLADIDWALRHGLNGWSGGPGVPTAWAGRSTAPSASRRSAG